MTIAILGTGLMGSSIAERFLAQGQKVCVYNRTRSKTRQLKRSGARVTATAQEAIAQAECVLFLLTDYSAIREVLHPCKRNILSGKTYFQMSTIAPAESLSLRRQILRLGGSYGECPVLGSVGEARRGKLLLMFAGEYDLFQRWRGLLRVLDPHPRFIGEPPQAAVLKLALNQLIAAEAVAFSVSFGMIAQSGVKKEIFADILRRSSLYAPLFDKKLPLWTRRRYRPVNFPVKHLLKDVRLILSEIRRRKIDATGVRALGQLYARCVTQGFQDADYAAVYEAVNPISP